MEPTLTDLKRLTNEFFLKHWNAETLQEDAPEWSDIYRFEGSLPNYDKQGVYAFVQDNIVTYIGVGASKGNGRYAGHGLGKRFQAYSRVENDKHVPKDPRLVEAGGMITLGFNPTHSYLAYALEMYLIGKMNTKYNENRPTV